MSDTPLAKIEKILSDDDFATFIPEVNEESPFEQLYVSLGEDSNERDLVLQMIFINDLANSMGMEDEVEDAFLLQFFVAMPYIAKDKTKDDVARLLLTLNRIIPVGALGLSYDEGTIYYQYVLATEERSVPEKVLLEVTSMIAMFVTEFVDKIGEVAEGSKTGKEIIDAFEEAGLKIPPVAPPEGIEG